MVEISRYRNQGGHRIRVRRGRRWSRGLGLRIQEDELEVPALFAGGELELAPAVPGRRWHLVCGEDLEKVILRRLK
jgi:hypothetical protein